MLFKKAAAAGRHGAWVGALWSGAAAARLAARAKSAPQQPHLPRLEQWHWAVVVPVVFWEDAVEAARRRGQRARVGGSQVWAASLPGPPAALECIPSAPFKGALTL